MVKCEWKKCQMKVMKYTILYCVFVKTFVIPFYYGSETIINHGSGSNFLTSYGWGSASTRQKSYGSYGSDSGSGSTTLEKILLERAFRFQLFDKLRFRFRFHPTKS